MTIDVEKKYRTKTEVRAINLPAGSIVKPAHVPNSKPKQLIQGLKNSDMVGFNLTNGGMWYFTANEVEKR